MIVGRLRSLVRLSDLLIGHYAVFVLASASRIELGNVVWGFSSNLDQER